MKKGFFEGLKEWLIRWLSVTPLGSLENASAFSQLSGMWRGFHGFVKKHSTKKLPAFFLLWLALSASSVLAAPLEKDQKWIESADAGLVFPVSPQASANYATGIGGDVMVGYRFDRDFSLSTSLGYYDMDRAYGGAASGEWIYVPLMEVVRLNFGDGWVRPYVLLGVGASLNSYSAAVLGQSGKATTQQTGFLTAPGAGVLFRFFSDLVFYVQCRVDMNFLPSSGIVPQADSPSLFIPLKLGISVFAL